MSAETYLPIAIPVVVLVVVLLRNRRPRPLVLGRIWIMPVVITLLIGMGLYFTPHEPFGPGVWAGFAAAVALGALAGWWRGKAVRITRGDDGGLHAQATPWGLLLLVALFLVRALLRQMADQQGAGWHVDAGAVTDALMLFALSLVVTQRVEMGLRARRLLAPAPAAAGAP